MIAISGPVLDHHHRHPQSMPDRSVNIIYHHCFGNIIKAGDSFFSSMELLRLAQRYEYLDGF